MLSKSLKIEQFSRGLAAWAKGGTTPIGGMPITERNWPEKRDSSRHGHFEACALKRRENSSSFRSIERLKIFRLADPDFGS
jgi:hypothetical protein